jgi:hypothetical protein
MGAVVVAPFTLYPILTLRENKGESDGQIFCYISLLIVFTFYLSFREIQQVFKALIKSTFAVYNDQFNDYGFFKRTGHKST